MLDKCSTYFKGFFSISTIHDILISFIYLKYGFSNWILKILRLIQYLQDFPYSKESTWTDMFGLLKWSK